MIQQSGVAVPPSEQLLPSLFVALIVLISSGCAAASFGAGAGSEEGRLDIAAIADTAALHAALAADPFIGAGSDTAVVSIRYDTTGALSARVHHPAAAAEDIQRVQGVLTAAFPPTGAPRTGAWFLLARDAAPRLEPFIPTSEERPRFLNRAEIQRDLRELMRDPGMVGRSIDAQLLIAADGSVIDARVVRGSGSAAADGALLDIIRRARFSPARLDGFPVSVWMQVPVAIRRR